MGKRIYLIIIYIFTLFCIIAGVLGNVFNMFPFSMFTYNSIGSEISFDQNFNEFNNIDIDMKIGHIKIVRGDNYSVNFTGGERLAPSMGVDGKTLNITQHGTQRVKRFNGISINEANCRLTITVPADADINDMSVCINMGNLIIENTDIKELTADIDMGNLEIHNSKTDSSEITVNMGNAELDYCDYKKMNISVDMGNITVKKSDADQYGLALDVDMGNISVYDVKQKNSYNINSNSTKLLNAEVNMGNISIKK